MACFKDTGNALCEFLQKHMHVRPFRDRVAELRGPSEGLVGASCEQVLFLEHRVVFECIDALVLPVRCSKGVVKSEEYFVAAAFLNVDIHRIVCIWEEGKSASRVMPEMGFGEVSVCCAARRKEDG